jgi:cytochrome c peroxidase
MNSRLYAAAAWSIALAACKQDASGADMDRDVRMDAVAADAAVAARDAGEPPLDAKTEAALQALHYDSTPPPPDPSNAFADDPAARAFGQRLFFETALSGRLLSADNDGTPPTLGQRGEAGRVSCASCHVPKSGFYDSRSHHQQISLASQWTRRRTPTLLEVAFQPLFNWDARHDTMWSQAIGVMESAVEFNSGRLFIAEQLFRLHRDEYERVFGAMPALDDPERFPQLAALEVGCDEGDGAPCLGKPGSPDYDAMSADAQTDVTRVIVNAAKAIEAYVRQLRCGPSRFDAWLDGERDALGASEQRGAALFVGRGDCVRCHSGPRLSDGAFHNVGLRPATVAIAFTDNDDHGAAAGLLLALSNPLGSAGPFSDGDRGALPATVTAAYEGAFQTPTLRCAAQSPSFMHTGQLRTPEQVVAFFDQGGHPPPGYPGVSEIAPLGLDDQERSDLAAFLRALTGPGPAADLLVPPAP